MSHATKSQTTAELIAAAQSLVANEIAATQFNPATQQKIVLTNSFQAEDMVLLHMVRRHVPDIPVLFLDTGYHFTEVLGYRDRIASDWRLNLINLQPALTTVQQEAQFGILNQTDPSRCCQLRKVQTLFAALEDYAVWFTGLRREQARTRAALQELDDFPLPSGRRIRKLSPLAEWSARDVWSYAADHNIPLLSLYDKGYTSIGCEPCTTLPIDPADPRSGRWGGQKLECGIHLPTSR